MSEPVAATIYAAQLATLQEGFPLWDPSPGSQPAVEIADVGYIEFGAWSRLFNASKPPGDPSNNFGVPDEFQQLNVGQIRERSSLPAKVPIRSESVEQRGVEVSISAGPGLPVQPGGGFSFKCSKEHGAVLLLGDDADRRDAFSKEDFVRYIIEQSSNWLDFANRIQKRGIMLDDLVLVTGCDKTSSWACAAFSKESSEAGVSFNVGQPGIAEGGISISWAWKNCSSVATRSGPPQLASRTIQYPSSSMNMRSLTDEEGDTNMVDMQTDLAFALPPPRDQCVFLRGYKMSDRKTWSARRLLRRKKKYDGFLRVPHKRRDDTEDPGSGSSRRPGLRSDQGTSERSQSSFYGGDGGSTLGGNSSAPGGKPEEHSGFSPDSDGSDVRGSESLDSEVDDEIHLRMLLGQYKEPTFSDIVLDYILETSTTELALVHDDDVFALLRDNTMSAADFEFLVHDISPKIYVDGQGMLETTYHVSLLNTVGIQRTNSSKPLNPTLYSEDSEDLIHPEDSEPTLINENLHDGGWVQLTRQPDFAQDPDKTFQPYAQEPRSPSYGTPSTWRETSTAYSYPSISSLSMERDVSTAYTYSSTSPPPSSKALKYSSAFLTSFPTHAAYEAPYDISFKRPHRSTSLSSFHLSSQDGEEDENRSDRRGGVKGRLGGARAPGACDPCKQSKVKCVFTVPGAKCRRCTHGGLDCRVSDRKQKPRPPSHEELLSRLLEKDRVILRLLRDGAGPESSTDSLPPFAVWDKHLPKAEVDRRVALWITEARKRVRGVQGMNEDIKMAITDTSQPVPDIIRAGIVTPHEVDLLFRIFFDKINMFFTICDPILHTPLRILHTSIFLFTTICAVASRHYGFRPSVYLALLHAAKQAAGAALNGPKSIETCQAYLLLGVYHPPPQTFPEDRTFLYIGLAIRFATDLELHIPQPVHVSVREEEARESLNRARVWLNCFCSDQSISTQLGKPSALAWGKGDMVPYDLRSWWGASVWNSPHDIHICAYANLFQVVSGFHEVVIRRSADADSHSALDKQRLDLSLVQSHADKIDAISTEWAQRLAANSALRPHPATKWRDNLWPFLVSYAKLVVLSIGLQDGMRQGLKRDNPFADQCVETAMNILMHVTGTLAKLGYLRYCVEAHFVFMGFAAAFLLKILRPKFAFMMRPGLADRIITLVQRLIDLLGSDAVAIDSRHTPRLYARFLDTVLVEQNARLVRRAASSTSTPHPTPPVQEATPTPQWIHNFFGPQSPYMEADTNVPMPPVGGDNMMLHSMAAITDPRFWEDAIMPGFAWAAVSDGGDPSAGINTRVPY